MRIMLKVILLVACVLQLICSLGASIQEGRNLADGISIILKAVEIVILFLSIVSTIVIIVIVSVSFRHSLSNRTIGIVGVTCSLVYFIFMIIAYVSYYADTPGITGPLTPAEWIMAGIFIGAGTLLMSIPFFYF